MSEGTADEDVSLCNNLQETKENDNGTSQTDGTTNNNEKENSFSKENDQTVLDGEHLEAMDTQNDLSSLQTETSATNENKSDGAVTSAQQSSDSNISEVVEGHHDYNRKNSTAPISVEDQKPTIDNNKQIDENTFHKEHSPSNVHSTSDLVQDEQRDNNSFSHQSQNGEHHPQTNDQQMDLSNTLLSNNNQTTDSHSNPFQETFPSPDDSPVPKTNGETEDAPDLPRDVKEVPTDSDDEIGTDNIKLKECLDLRFHDDERQQTLKPNEIEKDMPEPDESIDEEILNRIEGSMIGMALGDALGAHVEFRPHNYLLANPVIDLVGGGTWGLQKGQFTDDTSMALCLANSLVVRRAFVPYDQLVRYKWWYKYGYMSSTGQCFDIGNATRQSIVEFEHRQKKFVKDEKIVGEMADYVCDRETLKRFDENCSEEGVAGNGALMRLAPVPLFFYRHPSDAVEYSGQSGKITHGDDKAYDACRFYGALIVAALNGYTKDDLLDEKFYSKNESWFGGRKLHPDIQAIAEGSYKKKKDYAGGIRGKGYIVSALEAALWAFWSDEESFKRGALNAVNLGDDTDTTAAIYGQLAGAYYGYDRLPTEWLEHVYAHTFLRKLSKWIGFEGQSWSKAQKTSLSQ